MNSYSKVTLCLIVLMVLTACGPKEKNFCPGLKDLETNLLQSIDDQLRGPLGEYLVNHDTFMMALGSVTGVPASSLRETMMAHNVPRLQQNIDRLEAAKQQAPPGVQNALNQLQKTYERLQKEYQEIQKCINGEHGHDPRNPCLNPKDYKDKLDELQNKLEELGSQQVPEIQEKLNSLVGQLQQSTNAADKTVEGMSIADMQGLNDQISRMHKTTEDIRDTIAEGATEHTGADLGELHAPGLTGIQWLGNPWAFGDDSRLSALEKTWEADRTIREIEQLLEQAKKCKKTPQGSAKPSCPNELELSQLTEKLRQEAWRHLQTKELLANMHEALSNTNPSLNTAREIVSEFYDSYAQVLRGSTDIIDANTPLDRLLSELKKAENNHLVEKGTTAVIIIELEIARQTLKDYQQALAKLKECQERNAKGN